MQQMCFAHAVRALKDFDGILVHIEPYRSIGRVVYNKACWMSKSRKKRLRHSNALRFKFRQFEADSVERLIDIARAFGA
jgi:hypothetical protein